MLICLQAPVPAVTAAAADRSLAGVALPYGVPGRTSAGTVTIDAGAVTVPADLRRVKLFRDHGRQTPVGYTTAADDTAERLRMTFHAAATPDGDTALLEAAEGIRDCLSVELDDVVIRAGHVTAATLTAVALVPIPAFTGADLAAADTPEVPPMNPAPAAPAPAAPPAAPPAQPPAQPAPPAQPPAQPPAAPPVPAQPAPNQQGGQLQASLNPIGGALTAAPPVPTFAAAVARIRDNLNGAPDPDAATFTAALSDVVPANDAQGFLRDQWLGEIWTPLAAQRHYIPAIGSAPLTGMRIYGWKWQTRPVVGPYAGSKAAIPSNPVKIVPAEANAYRLAGGWDVDRIFVDLGAPGFLEAMFQAATIDAANKTEAHVSATLLAGATDLGYVATLTAAFGAIGAALSPYSLTPSFIALASDVWAAYSEMTTDEAPWWLVSSSSVNLSTGDGSIGGQSVFCDAALPAGTVLAGARQAATYYSAPSGSPLRVQAVNIPNGGIDIAVFLYAGEMINDDRGVVKVIIGTDPGGAAAALTAGKAAK